MSRGLKTSYLLEQGEQGFFYIKGLMDALLPGSGLVKGLPRTSYNLCIYLQYSTF